MSEFRRAFNERVMSGSRVMSDLLTPKHGSTQVALYDQTETEISISWLGLRDVKNCSNS